MNLPFPITTPTMVIDRTICQRNIKAMIARANKASIRLRPHFKTHQSIEVGRWFREAGIKQITVSSVGMARYFASDAWRDITIAIPCNVHEIQAINSLAATNTINLTVDHPETMRQIAAQARAPLGIYIKVNVRNNRVGVLPEDHQTIREILRIIDQRSELTWKGFLGHAGQSYHVKGQSEIQRVHRESLAIMRELKKHYRSGYPDIEASLGDTPSCSIVEKWPEIDEIRPGNFVFYDLMQWQIGTCSIGDIAAIMYCPIISIRPEREEIIIYGGGIHFSKDFVEIDGQACYGQVLNPRESPPIRLISLSQEHGILKLSAEQLKQMQIGDILPILPIHSCYTANLMPYYQEKETGALLQKYRY